MEYEFKKTEKGNYYLKLNCGNGLSFNPNPSDSATMFFGSLSVGDFFGSDLGLSETAICMKDGSFKILNGDFREEYIACHKEGGIDKCIEFYKEKEAEWGSSWSTGE